MIVSLFSLITSLFLGEAYSKEIALTFDDAPMGTTPHFESVARTDVLIKKLKDLSVPPVIVFANACKGDASAVVRQLKKYKDAGHKIGNHSCSHPRFDKVGFEVYSADSAKGEHLLAPLMTGQKFFRYPFLNEGTDVALRDRMREWLKQHQYRNGFVSIDNDDYAFSGEINRAKAKNRKIDYSKVEALFLKHVLGAADFYDALAVKTLGRSPKHVLLLHEKDATVLFVDSLVKELRRRGWKLISAEDAYRDPLYTSAPRNTHSGNGLIAQLGFEKTGKRVGYNHWDEMKAELRKVLGE